MNGRATTRPLWPRKYARAGSRRRSWLNRQPRAWPDSTQRSTLSSRSSPTRWRTRGMDHPSKDGALYGVPMFLKDLGSGLIGRTQDSAWGLMRGTVLKATDPTIENFLHAGLVPLRRSSTTEFGLTFDTLTKDDGE